MLGTTVNHNYSPEKKGKWSQLLVFGVISKLTTVPKTLCSKETRSGVAQWCVFIQSQNNSNNNTKFYTKNTLSNKVFVLLEVINLNYLLFSLLPEARTTFGSKAETTEDLTICSLYFPVRYQYLSTCFFLNVCCTFVCTCTHVCACINPNVLPLIACVCWQYDLMLYTPYHKKHPPQEPLIHVK